MSTIDTDDLEVAGYFLPEDRKYRLEKLSDYAEFLSKLAQPRSANEEADWLGPQIQASEVAICMELFAEQLEIVLDELTCPAYRTHRQAAQPVDVEPETAKEKPDDADGRYLFGVTLDQIDRLNRLLSMISTHGDVVVASDDAKFAKHTLSLLGDAICNDVEMVREVIHEVESQRLGPACGSQIGVGEEQAAYHAGRARLSMDGASHYAGSSVESLLGDGKWIRYWKVPGSGFAPIRKAVLEYH